MSIDKESTGLPAINVHRSDTKVNVGIVAGILIFLVVAAAVAFWASRRNVTPDGEPSGASEMK